MTSIIQNGRLFDQFGNIKYKGINGYFVGQEGKNIFDPVKYLLIFTDSAHNWNVDITQLPNPPLRLEGPMDFIELTLESVDFNPENKVALVFSGYAN